MHSLIQWLQLKNSHTKTCYSKAALIIYLATWATEQVLANNCLFPADTEKYMHLFGVALCPPNKWKSNIHYSALFWSPPKPEKKDWAGTAQWIYYCCLSDKSCLVMLEMRLWSVELWADGTQQWSKVDQKAQWAWTKQDCRAITQHKLHSLIVKIKKILISKACTVDLCACGWLCCVLCILSSVCHVIHVTVASHNTWGFTKSNKLWNFCPQRGTKEKILIYIACYY